MLRDITIGQYIPEKSPIHSLDPRTKILGGILYIVMIFMIDRIEYFALVALFLVALMKLAKLPVKYLIKGLKPLRMILILTMIVNLYTTPGPMWVKFIFPIAKEGVYKAIFMALRLSFLVVGTSILTLTTSPISLTEGIERLLAPLKKIRVPVHEFAMMMTIALRFIPTLMEEADKIQKAQTARGADFETGGVFRRAKNLVPLLVPMFLVSIRRAEELAEAMESRCYRGDEGRTRMHPLHYGKADAYAALVLIVFFGGLRLLERYV